MELRRIPGELRHLVARHADLDEALVDRRARAGRALVVHRRDRAFVPALGFLINDDLGVLPPKLDHAPRIRVQLRDGHGNGVDLLHEFRAQRLAQGAGAGPRDEGPDVIGRDVVELVANGHEQFHDLLGLAGFMALIV